MHSRYLIFLLCLLGFYSFASEEDGGLTCKELDTRNGRDIFLSSNDMAFTIKSPRRSCNSRFTYEQINFPSEKWMITSLPTEEELGLNAQRELFIAPSKKSEAIYIGAIPVDAISIGTNTYRNLTQSGGSIYETVYQINESSVETKTPSRELVISDSLCVYEKESDSACQTMTGTFDKPLCLYTDGEKKILEESSSCSELLQNGN